MPNPIWQWGESNCICTPEQPILFKTVGNRTARTPRAHKQAGSNNGVGPTSLNAPVDTNYGPAKNDSHIQQFESISAFRIDVAFADPLE